MGKLKIIISKEQGIINAINSQVNFTSMTNSQDKRYVVGIKNLFTGTNPSLQYKDIYSDVYQAVRDIKVDNNISIGGWTDNFGNYHVDKGFLVDDINDANNIGAYIGETHFFDLKLGKLLDVQIKEN